MYRSVVEGIEGEAVVKTKTYCLTRSGMQT